VCCAALAVGLADEFNWQGGSTVTLGLSCDYDGCKTEHSATNQGDGMNQVSWECLEPIVAYDLGHPC
jgi:hypothetical protein